MPVEVPALVDLMQFDSLDGLIKLGLDILKAQLGVRGMKIGGDLRQRAERLWSARGIPIEQLDKSLLAPPQKKSRNA